MTGNLGGTMTRILSNRKEVASLAGMGYIELFCVHALKFSVIANLSEHLTLLFPRGANDY
jgi:hypothetical protein